MLIGQSLNYVQFNKQAIWVQMLNGFRWRKENVSLTTAPNM